MENIFRDVAEVEVYIDDTGIFSDSWEQHLATEPMAHIDVDEKDIN